MTTGGVSVPQLRGSPLARLVNLVAARYGLQPVTWRALSRRHNTTLRLHASPIRTANRASGRDAEQFVLKIQDPAETDLVEVRSEMQWLAALAHETDLLIPHPVATLDGSWVTEVDMPGSDRQCLCRLTRWVPGRILGRGERLVHFSRLGELIAGLHNHATRFRPPEGFRRRRWDRGLLRQRLALIEEGVRDGLVTAEQRDVFRTGAEQGDALMQDLDARSDAFGLIHSDLGGSNHIYHDGRAGAIDFEMSGYGYYLCDLAELLWGVQHVRHFPQIRESLLSGYRCARDLPPDLEQRLGAAIAIVAVSTIGFLVRQRRGDLSYLASYFVEHLRKMGG